VAFCRSATLATFGHFCHFEPLLWLFPLLMSFITFCRFLNICRYLYHQLYTAVSSVLFR
jgi:hypothetical protein